MRPKSLPWKSLPRNCILLFINYIFSVSDSIGKEIQKQCSKIFPLQNVLVRKVKLLKKPKFDLTKLMELYQDKPELEIKGKKEATGAKDEPKNLLTATAPAAAAKKWWEEGSKGHDDTVFIPNA